MSLDAIGVVGAGVMGCGVAHEPARTGHRVVLVDVSAAALESAAREIEQVIPAARFAAPSERQQIHTIRGMAMTSRCRTESAPECRGSLMTKRELLDLIAQHTREILPGLDAHQFVPSDRLVDLGANSVDRAEIAMLVQESLGLSVPRVELFGPKNIGELADLFLRKFDAA